MLNDEPLKSNSQLQRLKTQPPRRNDDPQRLNDELRKLNDPESLMSISRTRRGTIGMRTVPVILGRLPMLPGMASSVTITINTPICSKTKISRTGIWKSVSPRTHYETKPPAPAIEASRH